MNLQGVYDVFLPEVKLIEFMSTSFSSFNYLQLHNALNVSI